MTRLALLSHTRHAEVGFQETDAWTSTTAPPRPEGHAQHPGLLRLEGGCDRSAAWALLVIPQ
jgi:hypothetical protein